MNTLGPGIWQENMKITENVKYTLQDVKYGEENFKKVENLEMSTVGHGIWQEN